MDGHGIAGGDGQDRGQIGCEHPQWQVAGEAESS